MLYMVWSLEVCAGAIGLEVWFGGLGWSYWLEVWAGGLGWSYWLEVLDGGLGWSYWLELAFTFSFQQPIGLSESWASNSASGKGGWPVRGTGVGRGGGAPWRNMPDWHRKRRICMPKWHKARWSGRNMPDWHRKRRICMPKWHKQRKQAWLWFSSEILKYIIEVGEKTSAPEGADA